jgi:DNA-binding MarR family transcriptional regulator
VGEAIAIKRANMVPIIARLIERGLVARTRVDGRSLALRVTAEGAKLAAEAWQRIAAHEARFCDRLDPADLQTVLDALPVLRAVADPAED